MSIRYIFRSIFESRCPLSRPSAKRPGLNAYLTYGVKAAPDQHSPRHGAGATGRAQPGRCYSLARIRSVPDNGQCMIKGTRKTARVCRASRFVRIEPGEILFIPEIPAQANPRNNVGQHPLILGLTAMLP